jgi:hypothetical protein
MHGVDAMRRGIEIRVAFAPTRSSAMHLRAAYAVVSPTAERTVVAAEERVVDDKEDGAAEITPRRRKTGDSP